MYGNVFNKDAVVIVPSDATNFARGVCNGIYVGGAGNITVVTEAGSVVITTLFSLPFDRTRYLRISAAWSGAVVLMLTST